MSCAAMLAVAAFVMTTSITADAKSAQRNEAQEVLRAEKEQEAAGLVCRQILGNIHCD